MELGLALDAETQVEEIIEYLDVVDCVLIMTIKAGFSGQKFMPEMCQQVKAMSGDEKMIKEKYHTLEMASFDSAILEKIEKNQATALKVDLGWSDPGTLYALKEALAPEIEKNCEQGLVLAHDTRDSLICNEDRDKLLAVVGLEGMVVVNTKDAMLVCHKDDVPKVKELLEKIEQKGLDKYL